MSGIALALLLAAGGAVAAELADPLEPVRAAILARDFARARDLLQEPARDGSAAAQYLLGCIELGGLAGVPDRAAARHWFEQAAIQQDARAAWSLATLLAGEDPPDATAARWLEEARRLGLSPAEQAAARGGLPLEFLPARDLTDSGVRAEALWRAAAAGDMKTLSALAQAPTVAATDEFGRGALARAAASGNVAAVRLLLERGALAATADRAGMTPLMLAAQAGSAAVVDALLAATASGLDAADAAGNTALMYAAGSGDLAAVERLLAAGASVKARNAQDWSALDFAPAAPAGSQAAAIAARLVSQGATAVSHLATAAAAPDSVRRAAPVDGYAGWPDIAVAATRQDGVLITTLLTRGADPNSVLPDGTPVLLVAVRARAAQPVKALLVAGADPARADRHGATALGIAAASGDEEILRTLLVHGAHDPSGSALLVAVKNGQTGLVQALLANRASPEAADRQARTALMFAAARGEPGPARALLDAGADSGRVDAQGRSAAWYAAQAGQVATLALLVEHHATLDRADLAGLTPLAAASDAGQAATVKVLLDARVAVSTRDTRGETPLHLAAAGGHAGIVAQLLAARADKDAVDAMGDTPLMIAARSGSAEAVTLLLRAGASRRLRNRERASAEDIAAARGFTGIAQLLSGAD